MRRGRQAGFTLIELMVGLVVASIAVGFIFRIYATSAVAYRSLSQVAEVMQSLRTAKQTMTKELRTAGLYARYVNTLVNTGTAGHIETGGTAPGSVFMYNPIQVVNSNSSSDELRIIYGDPNTQVLVPTTAVAFATSPTAVTVASTAGFAAGNLVIAVHTTDNGVAVRGAGCLLKLTAVTPTVLTYDASGAPYNSATNPHCWHLGSNSVGPVVHADKWNDGKVIIMKAKVRSYRIKPSDARGVLQMSETQGQSNDWQDLAFGFVDMQFALQVYEPAAADAADADGFNGGAIDWYSGSNLSTLVLNDSTAATGKEVLQARVNLLARTIAEVEGVGTTVTPSMLGDSTKPNSNPIGDHDSVTISSISNTASPYYGNYSYRMVGTVVDLRNLGIGRQL